MVQGGRAVAALLLLLLLVIFNFPPPRWYLLFAALAPLYLWVSSGGAGAGPGARGRPRPSRPAPFLWFLALSVISALSLPSALSPASGAAELLLFLVTGGGFFMAGRFIAGRRTGGSGILVIVPAILILEVPFVLRSLARDSAFFDGARGTLENPNLLGAFSAAGLVLATGGLLRPGSPKGSTHPGSLQANGTAGGPSRGISTLPFARGPARSAILTAGLAASGLLLLLSSSTGAFLGAAFGIILLLAIGNESPGGDGAGPRRYRRLLYAAITAVVLFPLLLPLAVPGPRAVPWRDAAAIWNSAPGGIGYGRHSFELASRLVSPIGSAPWGHAHNLFLQTGATGGIFGAAILLTFLYVWAARASADPSGAAAGALIIHSAFDYLFWSPPVTALFFLLLGASSRNPSGAPGTARAASGSPGILRFSPLILLPLIILLGASRLDGSGGAALASEAFWPTAAGAERRGRVLLDEGLDAQALSSFEASAERAPMYEAELGAGEILLDRGEAAHALSRAMRAAARFPRAPGGEAYNMGEMASSLIGRDTVPWRRMAGITRGGS